MGEDVLERRANSVLSRMKSGLPWGTFAEEIIHVMFDLLAEVRELRKDRERLDWLGGGGMKPGGIHLYGTDICAQIDAAMAREEK